MSCPSTPWASRIRQNLEEHLGAPPVEFEVSKFIDTEQIDASVAGDGLAKLFVVGGLDELVDQGRGGDVADAVAGHRGGCAQCDQQGELAAAA